MTRAASIALLFAALLCAAPALAQPAPAAASPAPLGATRESNALAQAVARAVAARPRDAGETIAVAVARTPEAAAAIVTASIAAAPAAAPRIAAAAATAAPDQAGDIVAAAVTAAVTAAGAAPPAPGAAPEVAANAVATASVKAAAAVAASVITAMTNSPEPAAAALAASQITARAVAAAMIATTRVTAQAALAAGGSPTVAKALADEAATLAATTVTKGAVAAATDAVKAAAANDGNAAAEAAKASAEAAAQTAAKSASIVASGVAQGAVAGSAVAAGVAPTDTWSTASRAALIVASQVTETAVAASSQATLRAAAEAAIAAGASPANADALGAAAAADVGAGVGQSAAEATEANFPDVTSRDAASAMLPALAGGVMGLRNARNATAAVAGQAARQRPIDRLASVPGGAPPAGAQQGVVPPIPSANSTPAAAPSLASGERGFLDDPTKLVPAIFSVLAFLTVIGLSLPWLQPDLFAARLKTITDRRGELSQQRRQRLEQQRPSFRRSVASGRVNFMRAVLQKLNLQTITEQPELKKKLLRAGKRNPGALITFTFLRLALPVGAGGFAALLLFGSSNVHMAPILKLLICLGAALFGYLLPDILVSNAVAKRQQDIQKKFPDALDLMVICIEAGISLEAAFARVSDEMAVDAPALSEEVAITTAELSFLADRRQALENLSNRTNTQSIKSLVTSLIQSEKYGTPLGAALRVVSQESREGRMAKAEEKAAGLPAKLTVPMVTFFLPVLFLVLIGPTIIQVMKAFSGGG